MEIRIKLWDTWKQVKGVFEKPRLIFQYGDWYKSSGLPVWRNGRIVYMTKRLYSCCEKVKTKKWRNAIKVGNIDIPGSWIEDRKSVV